MRKILIIMLLALVSVGSCGDATAGATKEVGDTDLIAKCDQTYQALELQGLVSLQAFRQAYDGYLKIKDKKRDILTIIDFSKPSTEKRLFVIDMKKMQLLFSSVVAHGRNSGGNYATSFSNKVGSYKSSLGFYITENTYRGKNGYSLILNGLEQGINNNARQRAIVVHGARYADPSICRGSRLGRSLGCPALPPNLTRPIIDAIKGGSVMYIYANSQEYLKQSKILTDYHLFSDHLRGTPDLRS